MKIEDVFTVIRNGASIKQYVGAGGIPITRIETIADRFVDREKMGYANINDIGKYDTYVLQDGDILMSHINSVQHLGKTAIYHALPEETIIHGMNLLGLRANKKVMNPEYANYFFNSYAFLLQLPRITKKSVNQASFTVSELKKLFIPCLTLEEQQKIVDVLKNVDHIINYRKNQISKLDELVKSRFIEMFGDPVGNPFGFRVAKLKKHIDLLSGFPFDSSNYTEKGVNICGGLIIMPQRIDWEHCKRWGNIDGYEQYTLKKDDIVIALDRPWVSDGFKIAMVDAEHLPALLIQRTARIRAIDLAQVYLFYCFLLCGFERHCNVTGSLVPHISAKDIQSFPIMLSPIELQNEFSDFVKSTDKSKTAIQKSLDDLETLKKSLMQQYFA